MQMSDQVLHIDICMQEINIGYLQVGLSEKYNIIAVAQIPDQKMRL